MNVTGSRGPSLRVARTVLFGVIFHHREDVLRVSWHQLRLIGGMAQRLLSERPTRVRRNS